MFGHDQLVNNNHHPFGDSVVLQNIQRKISKQKHAAEHRGDQPNGHRLFESPTPPSRIPHSTSSEFEPSLRHSAASRSLHVDDDVILTNDFNHQPFHPPHSRKVTKVAPKENHSISNSRPIPPRSSSASSALTTKHENKNSALTPSDIQRMKNVRRHEPAHVPSGPESKKSLITPDSWKSYPVVIKPRANKKPPPAIVNKPVRREKTPDPVRNQPSPVVSEKPKVEKPKRDRSASKPKEVEPPPAPKVIKKEKTKEELEKIRQYIEEKRREHEHSVTHEKQLKQVQERERKDKLKKLNEQIKKVAQQPLPPALVKKLKSTELTGKDQPEQTRDRLLQLLGPRIISEPPSIYHPNTPFEQAPSRDRSLSSSSSSSSDSIVEIQPPKIEQNIIHPRLEQFNQTEQRQQNLLRWALNLTQDCNHIEDKLKYLRPDGTQPFDIVPASRPNLQHDDGNLRSQTPVLITNNSKPVEPIIPSKVLRPSGRLIKLNQNRPSEYQGHDLPGVGNLRDPLLEQRIKRDRAAAKIQAAYRGYTVRKSTHWLNDRKQRLNDQSNRRPVRKSPKPAPHPTDLFDPPALNLDMRLSDDNFTIGSTLLRHYQRNGVKIIPSTPSPFQPEKMPHSTPLPTYSDDYEDVTSTRSLTPMQQAQKPEKFRPTKEPIPEKSRPIRQPTPEKPRIIQQPVPSTDRTSSRSSSPSTSVSSSTTLTPTPTPEPKNIPHRRSLSPPLPPQISSDNGRLIHPPAPSTIPGTSHRVSSDERRYSPDALERQLNAELHLLDGVEASMKQIDNMERLRSVALAQQEVVSLAQVLQHQRPALESSSEQRVRKPARQDVSSSFTSSSSSEKKPVRSGRREAESTSSSSETILTAREKRAREKFHSETELQAYEKRLKDVEQKIRSLDKRAVEVFDEKRLPSSPHVPARSNSESSISEDLPISHKSSRSRSTAVERKNSNGISEIRTETYSDSFEKESESSHRRPSVDAVTTDGSDIERRIQTYQDQVQKKKTELDQLKQRKNKETLRRREEELKKQLDSYNHQIETLRTEPVVPKLATPQRKSPAKRSSSGSSSSSTSTPTKPQESSIAEDLPVSTTPSQSKTNNIIGKQAVGKKERNFFDDDEEEEKEKPAVIKPLETPRDERDTQHDALSLSIGTDIGTSSETDNDDSRRPSTDIDKPILNLNTNLPPPLLKSKDDSDSSSSTTTPTSKKSSRIQSIERKPSPVVHDYDEDFSDLSQSPSTPVKEPLPKPKLDEIDVESIQEDLEEKPSLHDTNQSASSKSSGDEQSEILVLVKKSANTTPRRQEDKTLEDDFPPPPPPSSLPPVHPPVEVNYNDDTSHDVSEDEEVNEQENRVDQLTNSFLRTFIDEAIDQGQELQRLKGENNERNLPLTQDAEEWISKEDSTEEEYPQLPLESEPSEFEIDLSGLGEKNTDEPRVESPRKAVIEEPIKPFIPRTREQVTHVCDEALKILMDQNSDFSNRSTIRCRIPPSYFTTELQNAENEDTRRNHHAYCQMIFDLCVEILHEMDLENVQASHYPEWQKAKLVSKRFYRGKKPNNRREIEQVVRNKLLELLNITPRPVIYSKWRVFNNRRPGIEKFESVLDEEIRRNESEWVNYDADCTQMKFDIADGILDHLIQETLNECLTVVNKRFYLSSNSTRL